MNKDIDWGFETKQNRVNRTEAVTNGMTFLSRALPAFAVVNFGANAINRGLAISRTNITYTANQSQADNAGIMGLYSANFFDVSSAMAARASIEDAKAIGTQATPTDVDQPELYADNARQVQLSILTAPPAVLRTARDMFERYGYMINRPMVPPRLDPMTEFSYWQTADTTILGNMPAFDRQQLALEFEAGVTLWEDMNKIGTNPTNNPRSGVSY